MLVPFFDVASGQKVSGLLQLNTVSFFGSSARFDDAGHERAATSSHAPRSPPLTISERSYGRISFPVRAGRGCHARR
jgi:hypothetical protein